MAIFECEDPNKSLLDPIDVVQNTYDDLGLTQLVERDGSEWTRSVNQSLGIEQSFSDFYGETVVTTLSLSSSFDGDRELLLSASNALVFAHITTVAGGRTGGGGGTSTISVVYHTGGPAADEGHLVYIDPADSEAKLALYNGTDDQAEVAGLLTQAVTSGGTAIVATEGVVDVPDWTNIAGTVALTPGAYYYLWTAGEIRITPPASDKIVIVGRAITSTKLDIEINPAWDA